MPPSPKVKLAEVISITSHQLKTPLAVIKGYLEALLSGDCGEVNAFQKEYLEDALENVKRLFRFVDELLNISKIEEGRFKVKLKPVSLTAVTQEVLEDLKMWIKAQNCQVLFEPNYNLPKVLTDPAKIAEVIENLITNAVTYKVGRGEIKITIKRKGNKVIFVCRDNGIGIPSKDIKRVFSKFYRSERAMEINPSGSGLGLYINKAIVELSGGKIWFSKNKGPGMTFYFALPIAKTKTR